MEMDRAKRLKVLRDARDRKTQGKSKSDDEKEGEDCMEGVEEKELSIEKENSESSIEKGTEPIVEKEEPIEDNDDDDEEGFQLGPHQIHWDLKRNTQARLAVLEKRTQRAIVEILRERVQLEQQQDDEE